MADIAALKTIGDAWEHFTKRVSKHLCVVHETEILTPEAITDDAALAAFIRANKGVFEDRVLECVSGSPSESGSFDSVLRLLLEEICSRCVEGADPGPLDATLMEFDPLRGLELCRLLVWRCQGEWIPAMVADFFARRLNRVLEPHEAPPEMRDAIASQYVPWVARHATNVYLPHVVPWDLQGMSPRDIEMIFEKYIGMPIGDIETRLRPNHSSDSGFLGEEDRLGEVVWQDAKLLRELQVDRGELARRLDEVTEQVRRKQLEAVRNASPAASWKETYGLGRAPDAPIEVTVGGDTPVNLLVWYRGYLGCQSNPFHTLEVDRTCCDLIIVNRSLGTDQQLVCSGLAAALIRRFCFFEGRVPYRIEPELAARILGLSGERGTQVSR